MAIINGGGLNLTNPDALKEPAVPEERPTTEEQLAMLVITRLRQGFPKAALAACSDLMVAIKVANDL